MPSEIKLYNMDCMEAMKEMSDKAFDLAIVDPPYGIGKTWNKNSKGAKNFNGNYRNEQTPGKEYFNQVFRVSKNFIIWGANFYPYVWPSKNVIAWDKECTWEKDRKSEIELAVASKNHRPVSIFRHPWSGCRKGIETGISIIHPHQKPVGLYKWCLNNYATIGDKILDTHLGSGSIAIACYDMGYDLTGYEIEKDYYDAAVRRLENHKLQLTFI